MNKLVSIVGPTAVGKTRVAIQVARELDAEIISADSRQIFEEMTIGTAKPSREELALVNHHLIGSWHIEDNYTLGDYEKEALACLDKIFGVQRCALLVGGSGLYVKVIWEGMDEIPEIPPEVRRELVHQENKQGLTSLLIELEKKDPEYFRDVDQKNTHRVIRALEVIRYTNTPFSKFRTGKKVTRSFKNLKIGLQLEREDLNKRIDERMDQMIQDGLFEEATRLYPYRHQNALQTVGYKEIFDFMDEKYDREEAIRLMKRNSRRYAKRQMTWFKRDRQITWFDPDSTLSISEFIHKNLT